VLSVERSLGAADIGAVFAETMRALTADAAARVMHSLLAAFGGALRARLRRRALAEVRGLAEAVGAGSPPPFVLVAPPAAAGGAGGAAAGAGGAAAAQAPPCIAGLAVNKRTRAAAEAEVAAAAAAATAAAAAAGGGGATPGPAQLFIDAEALLDELLERRLAARVRAACGAEVADACRRALGELPASLGF